MKKFLPKSAHNPAGFTLVELLIVVAIIAILSIIGIVIYSGVQRNARDARRKADIDAVASAMEANYGKTTGGLYDPLAATMFASGVIPQDPVNTKIIPDGTCPGVCRYCIKQGAVAQTSAACATTGTDVGAGAPAGGSSTPYWVVCANLENPAGTFYCRANSQ